MNIADSLSAISWMPVLRLCLAGLCGTAIGIDREYRVKDAGFRTHFLVAVGSALMMLVSQYGFDEFIARYDGLRFDPSRIAAQVVSGIGFIGAGTIILHRQLVRGLTTAASLWSTAGIGLAAGAGLYMLAATATLLTLFGLEVLTLVFGRMGFRRMMLVFTAPDRPALDRVLDRLGEYRAAVVSYEVETPHALDGIVYRATLVLRVRGTASETRLIAALRASPEISIERIV